MSPGHPIKQFDEVAFRFELRVYLREIVSKCAGLVNAPHQITDLAYQLDRRPLLVIDGREISWEAFGRMLMTFGGWQFQMEIGDLSEEV